MNRKYLIILLALITISGLGYYFLYPYKIPLFNQKKVTFGEEFRLQKGQIAYFKEVDFSLKIISFQNSGCPKDTFCLWSGQDVAYQINFDGKTYDAHSGFGYPPKIPYLINVGNSDYETYAVFYVNSYESFCGESEYPDDCWSSAASRTQNIEYCDNIRSEISKSNCLQLGNR